MYHHWSSTVSVLDGVGVACPRQPRGAEAASHTAAYRMRAQAGGIGTIGEQSNAENCTT